MSGPLPTFLQLYVFSIPSRIVRTVDLLTRDIPVAGPLIGLITGGGKECPECGRKTVFPEVRVLKYGRGTVTVDACSNKSCGYEQED